MLNDSINEFIFVFKIKISSITDILSELKELQNKSEGNLNSLIKEMIDSDLLLARKESILKKY
jgi:hypothetical protein